MDEPTDVARRIRRDARANRMAVRYWAGWRLQLTYGPYEEAFEERIVSAARAYLASIGEPVPADRSKDPYRDLWHLSVSWRGGFPAEQGRRQLADLLAAIGVPEGKRAGEQVARTSTRGLANPQVTHWVWKDEQV